MIGYVMVGTNDLARSTKFYDATLAPLNLIQVECLDIYTAYANKDARDAIELYVTKPFDQEAATVGNGSMIALKAPSMEALIQFHITGQKNGGMDEGSPGPREEGSDTQYAYVRDPDGNKVCAFYDKTES
jgi:catechol 2,3-dioxygenase-like lactoylglutathione lyase family enzyme